MNQWRAWFFRAVVLFTGMWMVVYFGNQSLSATSMSWAFGIVWGLLLAQMAFFVHEVPATSLKDWTIDVVPGPAYHTIDVENDVLKWMKSKKKYRGPAHNRLLPYFGPRHSWGKYATIRKWRAQKRQEAKELEQAAQKFLMGCAQTPIMDFCTVLEKIRDIRENLSVKNWGR